LPVRNLTKYKRQRNKRLVTDFQMTFAFILPEKRWEYSFQEYLVAECTDTKRAFVRYLSFERQIGNLLHYVISAPLFFKKKIVFLSSLHPAMFWFSFFLVLKIQ